MRRVICIWMIVFLPIIVWAGIHTYVDESVLSQGTVIKLRVNETGIYCVTYDELKQWGLKPQDVCVLGYGGNMLSEDFTKPKWDDLPAVSFYMHKGADNVFNSGDYILFYARGVVGWLYNGDRWVHTRNPYSNYGYYFLSDRVGKQRLIQQESAQSDADVISVDWGIEYYLHEKEMVNLIDNSGSAGGGREFYGESLSASANTLSITFPTQAVRKGANLSCYVAAAASSSSVSTMTAKIAGSSSKLSFLAIPPSNFYKKAETASALIKTKTNSTGEQSLLLTYQVDNSGATAYLNYVELNVPVNLVMRGNALAITNTEYLNESEMLSFTLTGANQNVQIWRVTDGVNITQMPTQNSNGVLRWIGSNEQAEQYMAVDVRATGWKRPEYVGVVKNQNLHALRDKDYVIICPAEFMEPAIRLAKKHEEIDHLTWAVVTDEQVYNEFSSGTPDVTAYRWLMKMLYDRAGANKTQQPKNLLLMGNASFDNRNLLGEQSGVSRILVYEAYNSTDETKAYATDDYCGFLTDSAGIIYNGIFDETYAKMDIGVGRLPLRTLSQAEQVVNKLCTYMDDRVLGKWKNQICFLADDGDGGMHVEGSDEAAEVLRKQNLDFVVNKIYLDAYTQEVNASGERYPTVKNQFDNMISNGVLFMNYSGHGGYNNITNELFMTTNDIRQMGNSNQAFWFLATCGFAHFDARIPSAAEEAVLNPNGAAIGVLSACRTVYASQNKRLNKNLCDTLFGHTDKFSYHMTLGSATRAAKNMTGIDDNKMAYVLLGDPAIRLNYPTDYQVITTTKVDTLSALSVQSICGYIMDAEGDTANWFNGQMDITIWDKMQRVMTQDNDQSDESLKKKLSYNDYPNKLFTGQAIVTDGHFEYTFMVPKDIRYNYGNGRIVYYAYDYETREEAVGHFENFVVGGSSSVVKIDTVGPSIQLYLNNPSFVDGGKTYEFPHFYAEVYDENGINTVGSGIGHDLLMIIDDNPKMTYVLNDYFIAQNNTYQRGKVSYKMPEMEEGPHQLNFRAWDLLNNSNTASLNFQVVKGMQPTIYQVVTYPNPVPKMGTLYFHIEYDQPDEVVQTEIYIYDIGGKLLKRYQQTGAGDIQWNMSEMNLPVGLYVYQLKLKTPTSDYVTKAGKIIICD